MTSSAAGSEKVAFTIRLPKTSWVHSKEPVDEVVSELAKITMSWLLRGMVRFQNDRASVRVCSLVAHAEFHGLPTLV